jgi:hypothetical protein
MLMLRSLRKLSGLRLRAGDGDLGKPKNWLIDDAQWAVRYLVADLGWWPAHRRVLVAPLAFRQIDECALVLFLNGTRKDLEDSSPLARGLNGACPYEQGHAQRLGRLWHDGAGFVSRAAVETAQDAVGAVAKHHHDPHLHSWREALGCRLQAGNAEIGLISDFIAEDQDWTILYLVVDTGHWWAEKKLLVLPDWIEGVSWKNALVHLNVPRQLICDAPEFMPSLLFKREYEEELFGMYYGQAA